MRYSNPFKLDEENSTLGMPLYPAQKGNDLREIELLEEAFENLLQTARDLPSITIENESKDKQKIGFEVCLGDHLFHVSIIQYKHTTEITPPPLSPRELEIARLITKGMQNKGIAYELGLRPCTVSSYTKRIYLKLNVNSRAEMVARVLNDYAVFF